MSSTAKEISLEETPTWAVAMVCFVLVAVSIIMEHGIHLIGKWFTKKHKKALYEALEKIKAELMLMGFISLLLTVLQGPISEICVPKSVGATWHPCDKATEAARAAKEGLTLRRLLEFSDFGDEMNSRRILASAKGDKCAPKGMVPLVSAYGIHQLHIFIFVLAVMHILYCILTYGLGRIKMRKWKVWENETKTVEYQYYNDPERFRFTRDTSFGKRHLNFWTKSPISLWIVCFFRQFLTSVTKTDYLTLRHGFIVAHLAPGSETRFDFHKYIKRSLEDDFKVVVGISPHIWLFAVLILLTYTHGWFSYFWLPFMPLVVILMIGAKLQMIITKMGLHIQERGDVVKGAPVVKPGDELFWFGRPQLVLLLIHFVLFQNAFQLAFFVWSVYEFGISSCYHRRLEDIVIRIAMGVVIQVLCSYVTLPLYALVTQMGSTMKPTIFNERVAAALKNWHRSAKKHTKHNNKSGSNTPMSSRPVTPSHGMSPIHLLHNYRSEVSSYYSPPRISNADNWDGEGSTSPHRSAFRGETQMERHIREQELQLQVIDNSVPATTTTITTTTTTGAQLPVGPRPIRTQHEINMSLSDFSFGK